MYFSGQTAEQSSKHIGFGYQSPDCSHAAQKQSYQRRQPEKTLLYQIVQNNLNTFLAQCEAEGKPAPDFVKKEFQAFLECGILAYGFGRVHCPDCQYDALVAFSCKRRGFCGSCMAMRQNETAAHLVDSVIPKIPTVQWVLSLPAPLRMLVAYDSAALNFTLDTFTKTVFSWLRKKAKHKGIVDVASKAHHGGVTFIQRFGSALNLNTHFHSIFSAGVYTESELGEMNFHVLPSPTLADIKEISTQIAKKTHKWLENLVQEQQLGDECSEQHDLLFACYTASVRYQTALGPDIGRPLLRDFGEQPLGKKKDREERTVEGFNLHVSRPIGTNDRTGLERQLRYMGRPPLSDERLTMTAQGKISVKLKTPWSDGTSHILMTPMDFMTRLVALIPPPRKNQIRYHGVFAPNAKLRSKVVPALAKQEEPADAAKPSSHVNSKDWARMMARVYDIDVLECPRCQSRMKMISFVTESKAIKDILTSLKMTTAPPPIAQAAFVPEQGEIIYDYAA